jgi:hypothetical protein
MSRHRLNIQWKRRQQKKMQIFHEILNYLRETRKKTLLVYLILPSVYS